MYFNRFRLLQLAFAASCLIFVPVASYPQEGNLHGQQSTTPPAYFPSGEVGQYTGFFVVYLNSVGEPSLLAAAQKPQAHSYRFDYFSGSTGVLLAVRLSIGTDEDAEVSSAASYGLPREVHRTKHSVSLEKLDQFLELVKNTDFWSMQSMPTGNPDMRGGAHMLHPSVWVFEGVHDGTYHVVFRKRPEAGRFTDMVEFLLRDITNLDESIIPRPDIASQN